MKFMTFECASPNNLLRSSGSAAAKTGERFWNLELLPPWFLKSENKY
jgi:hypothetical protein